MVKLQLTEGPWHSLIRLDKINKKSQTRLIIFGTSAIDLGGDAHFQNKKEIILNENSKRHKFNTARMIPRTLKKERASIW